MRASDVFVVGGGPAGLATAIAMRLKGYSVHLADCADPPIDKACGEGLLPDSQAALRKLGVVVPASQAFPFRGIKFIDGPTTIEGSFPNGIGLGVRRPFLQSLLLKRAEQLGVQLSWNVKGIDLRPEGLFIRGHRHAASVIVGADGHKSLLRVRAGLNRVNWNSSRYGFRRHYRINPWSEYAELYWGNGFQIYVTPVAVDEVCVVLLTTRSGLRLDAALAQMPALSRRLASRIHTSQEMGALTISRQLKRISKPGFALVGDAAGSVDAITGEGLCLAFKAALALSDAVAAHDLSSYQRAHRTAQSGPARMATLLLHLGDHPRLRRRVFAGLAARPDVFAGLLSIHVGVSRFHQFKPSQVLGFGREFLAA